MWFIIYLAVTIPLLLLFIYIIIFFGRAYLTGAPFAVTTPYKVKAIVSLLQNKGVAGKKVVDLGSGDGRIVIALAKAGYEAHGYESNPALVSYARWRIRKEGLENRAFIHRKNFWKVDLSQYDAVVIFGVYHMMEKIEKKLQKELRSGALVVCNFFDFPKWKHSKEEDDIYLYIK